MRYPKVLLFLVGVVLAIVLVAATNQTNDTLDASVDPVMGPDVGALENETNETVMDKELPLAVVEGPELPSGGELMEGESPTTPSVGTFEERFRTNRKADIGGIRYVQSCVQTMEEFTELAYENCSKTVQRMVCNELNTSCHEEPHTIQLLCKTKRKNVRLTKERCEVDELIIGGKYLLKTEGYFCSVGEEDGYQVVICDSKRDGNGDGVCRSGESCMKFVLGRGGLKQYEKNSREHYTEHDDSYFTERIAVGVIA